jgi:hypothetical protein
MLMTLLGLVSMVYRNAESIGILPRSALCYLRTSHVLTGVPFGHSQSSSHGPLGTLQGLGQKLRNVMAGTHDEEPVLISYQQVSLLGLPSQSPSDGTLGTAQGLGERPGGILAGTYDEELLVIKRLEEPRFVPRPFKDLTYSYPSVTCLAATDEVVVIGTKDGEVVIARMDSPLSR